MSYFLLFLSVAFETLKNGCTNYFGKNVFVSTKDTILFNIVSGIGACCFFAVSADIFEISWFSLYMALIFSVITALANYFTLMSFATGPMSAATLLMYIGGMIIPAVFGITFYKQAVTAFQAIGCVLMIVSLFLSINLKKDKSMSIKWLLYAMGTFVSWGLVGICQQIHQNSHYAFEIDEFLFWTFVITTLIFAVMYFAVKNKDNESDGYAIKNKISFLVLLIGLLIAVVYKINLYLSGVLPSIVFYPIVNGGVLVLSALVALVIFKETLSIRQKAGIIIGVAAVCLLGI